MGFVLQRGVPFASGLLQLPWPNAAIGDATAARPSACRKRRRESLPLSKSLNKLDKASLFVINPPLLNRQIISFRTVVQVLPDNSCTIAQAKGKRGKILVSSSKSLETKDFILGKFYDTNHQKLVPARCVCSTCRDHWIFLPAVAAEYSSG